MTLPTPTDRARATGVRTGSIGSEARATCYVTRVPWITMQKFSVPVLFQLSTCGRIDEKLKLGRFLFEAHADAWMQKLAKAVHAPYLMYSITNI